MLIERDIYDAETEAKMAATDAVFKTRKSALLEQYKLLGARSRNEKDDYTIDDLRKFEDDIYRPAIKGFSEERTRENIEHRKLGVIVKTHG